MKAAGISDIKKELKEKSPAQLLELCLRLARFKLENKELLTYLLFEAMDPDAFLRMAKSEMAEQMAGINTGNLYWAKKSIRKILRTVNKYIRYTGSKTAEAELLIAFCRTLKDSGIPIGQSTALVNLYNSQLKKIHAAIATLHEDLQHDYREQARQL